MPDNLLALLDRRVAALRTARPDLEDAITLQEQLIRASLTSARPPRAGPFPLPREQVSQRIRAGIPLLHDQPVTVDVHFAADLFSRLVGILQARDTPDVQPQLAAVIQAATGGALDPERLFTEAFVQHHDHIADLALQTGLEPDVLTTLAVQSVKPQLRAYAQHLLPLVERIDDGRPDGASWQAGYCPVCGAWPLLGELRGVELTAFARCGGCGSGWRSRRLMCPYCGTDDFRDLRMLQVEGELRYRTSVCERCKGYLKVGNAFDPPPPELVALDDLASVHLDLAAIERGYQRPTGAGYTIEISLPEAEWVEELA